MSSRVEVITPVEDQSARQRLLRILEVSAADRRDSWEMKSDGIYVKRTPNDGSEDESPEWIGSFEALCQDAITASDTAKRLAEPEITANPLDHPRA